METKPWLVGFFGQVATRPGMYLGDEDVRSLFHYVCGYLDGREDLGEDSPEDRELLSRFETWLEKRTKLKGSWATHVEHIDPSKTNVRTMLQLFAEFLELEG